ncbi:MAG: selenocysteine-specific translation elongation factor, partial [Planctomycetota bacterium]
MSKDFILGTAGHIDHGKTSLVRALTGTDTDRLPEEKKRGITIELGYAYLEVGGYRLGVVDVPGHEKFIRQMLSGATGMDLAMLVVAADDSIKQQTREHLDILRMLDLAAGIVVITKADLVDPQWLELVREEVRELVAGTVFAEGEVIATSVKTLQGLDELRAALERAAARAEARQEQRRQSAPFRLPIDRAFVVEGFGTVVTGSVVSGRAQVGDALILQPSGVEVRVRGLQNHEQQAEFVSQGQRAAVNLAGVHHEELQRGQELAAPGYLRAATVMTVE